MPTVIVKCKPDFLPLEGKKYDVRGRLVVSLVANKAREKLPGVINQIDRRGPRESANKQPITAEMVWVDFAPISANAINAADILVIVYIPATDTTFAHRKSRREAIANLLQYDIAGVFEGDTSYADIHWEIEVFDAESSGHGVIHNQTAYSW